MNIVVLVKQVPDLADELEIADGTALDTDMLNWVINEFDDHALEEALHLKDDTGGTVTVLGLGTGTIDDILFTCLAKGADAAVKVGTFEAPPDSHTAARAFAAALADRAYDLVLTGVQAWDNLDGQVGPLLATYLEIPHVSVVTHIAPAGGGKSVTVNQEYAGGLLGEFEIDLPGVLGVQAAREVPRYAPVSRVRQIAKSATLEAAPVTVEEGAGITVTRMAFPESAGHAEMLEGESEEIVTRMVQLLSERGLLGGGAA